jgi:uncharacterized membrane protein
MDFLILSIILFIAALLLGIGIYLLMIRIFRTGKTDMFILALLGLVISDFMVTFLAVLCAFLAAGIV